MQDSVWQAVLGEIELTVSRANFATWFMNTRLLRFKDDILVIGVPNVFIKQQLEKKYNPLILELLEKNGVKPKSVEYKINSSISMPKKQDDDIQILNSNQ